MDRRAFMSGITVGLLAAPLVGEAQPAGKVWRIGYLGNGNPTQSATLNAFLQGLREFGWVEGQNVSIAYRWADGHLDRLPALASDLVKVPPDVLHLSGFPAVRAAIQATRTVPIVSALMGDPVAAGFAASLARPGGTVTGIAVQFQDLATKQLQMLKETVAQVVRVALLYDLTTPNAEVLQAAEVSARALGLKGRVLGIRAVPDLEGAFRTARAEDAKAMYVLPSPMLARHRPRLAELAVKYQLPGIYEEKGYVAAGGLMSYGPNFPDLFRRSARYVDQIFKGTKPGDLPIEQPTKFELIINVKTAKALGLTIPPSLLQRADQVIE